MPATLAYELRSPAQASIPSPHRPHPNAWSPNRPIRCITCWCCGKRLDWSPPTSRWNWPQEAARRS